MSALALRALLAAHERACREVAALESELVDARALRDEAWRLVQDCMRRG